MHPNGFHKTLSSLAPMAKQQSYQKKKKMLESAADLLVST
jgi:hypothetical protein